MQAFEHMAFLALNSMLGRQMFKHFAGICTLTRYYSIALITHGSIFIAFGETEPDFGSLPPLNDAALLFELQSSARAQGRRRESAAINVPRRKISSKPGKRGAESLRIIDNVEF